MAAKRGENLKFICKFLWENPGSTGGQVRRALCESRGIDATARPGYYAAYFYTDRFKDYWTRRDGGFYIAQKGIAQL